MVVVQQQIFDLRHDGGSPVFQNLCEVGGVAGVDSVRWRPEKENKLSTRVSNGVKRTDPLTFSPDVRLGSPGGAATHGEDEEESGELHRLWQKLNQLLQRARPCWSLGSLCSSETRRRPGRVSAPV